MDVKLNEVFTIKKGNRSARWKIIEHPYMPRAYAVIMDYCGLYGRMSNKMQMDDNEHIACGSISLEKAYEAAYNMT